MTNSLYIDRWLDLLEPENAKLKLTNVEIISYDNDPVVFRGEAILDLGDTRQKYRFEGKPDDLDYARRQIMRVNRARYDSRQLFRIVGADAKGRGWNLGYTRPSGYDEQGDLWIIHGEFEGLIGGETKGAPPIHGAEVMFSLPPELSMGRLMTARQTSEGDLIELKHALSVGETNIRFRYQPATNRLFIAANGTSAVGHPYLAETLGAPLRILFGQLLYPRLVAKTFTAAYSQVHLRRAHRFNPEAGFAALWEFWNPSPDKEAFWKLYAQLFTVVTRENLASTFLEGHAITRLYEEVIQSAYGTRWVWALTLASACEGLAKRLQHIVPPIGDELELEITALKAAIKNSSAGNHLKGVAIGALARLSEATARKVMRELIKQGLVAQGDVAAWDELRNQVTHGELVLPWSNEEEDGKILALASLLHALTRVVVQG